MRIFSPIMYLDLTRSASVIDWTESATITTSNITWSSNLNLGKLGLYVPIFNGTSSYIKCELDSGATEVLQGTTEITFGGWFYLDRVNTDLVLFQCGDSLTSGLVIEAVNTNLRCIVGTYDANYDNCTNVLQTGWLHIVVSFKDNRRRIYLNGTVINESNQSRTLSGTTAVSHLGSYKGTSNFFKGRIQTLFITSLEFSKKQISTLAKGNVWLMPLYDVNPGYGLDDYSGLSRDPTSHGTFTLDTSSPRYVSAITFPGNGTNYIKMGHYVPYLQTGFTMSVWFKTTRENTTQAILDNGKDGNYGLRFLLNNTNIVRILYGTGSEVLTVSKPDIEVNKWYMLTATWDMQELKLYINGALYDSIQLTTPPAFTSSQGYIVVGRSSVNYTNASYQYAYPFYGSVCDVRVYSTPLSAQDIYDLYTHPIQIDNTGIVWGYQLVLNENLPSFTNKGVVATGAFLRKSPPDGQVNLSETILQATYFDNL